MHDNEYLRYTQALDDDTLVVSLIGEVCYESRPVLDQAAVDIAAHGGPVRVDLGQVPFMDSTGVNFLVRQHHYVTGHGHRFAAARAQPHPARVLALCGLTALFDTGDLTGGRTGDRTSDRSAAPSGGDADALAEPESDRDRPPKANAQPLAKP